MEHQTFEVRMEYLYGRQFNELLARMPVGYLPMGTLERHGDHLPMGLDALKAHAVCCHVAGRVGGIVWPAHHYLGVHKVEADRATFHAEWGNVYISYPLAEASLEELLARAGETGFKVMVLYSGHYPESQRELIAAVAARPRAGVKVLAYTERGIFDGDGDHAGIWETSILAALRPDLVRMDRIAEANYLDHGWNDAHDPKKATPEFGRKTLETITERLGRDIREALA
jgi:creatinine amidohydrolase